jgi:hypothetical protein
MVKRTSNNPASATNLPTHDEMVANIIATYNRATPAQIFEGTNWYGVAQEFAETLVAGTRFSLYQGAGVIAALSPQQAWAINKRNATQVFTLIALGQELPRMHTEVQMAKIRAIIDADDSSYQNIARKLNGPKETSFYRNVAGDHSTPTVDRWAFLTATKGILNDKTGGIPKAAYPLIAAAWNAAAAILGLPVAILQAICWVIERGNGD